MTQPQPADSVHASAAALRLPRAQRIRSAAAAAIGNAFEYYDFFLYGTAAALIFNRVFFPTTSPMIGTVAAFAGYAVGFLSRPLGGLVFGYIGDRHGRKVTLTLTLALMGAATFLIGLLPTYHQIGMLAPVALLLLRLVQGFAAGGEWGGAILMATENAPASRRGLYGAWSQVGIGLGFILSAAAFYGMQLAVDADAFLRWGWRVPFLASAIIVAAGLVIRATVSESVEFERARKEKRRAVPLCDVVRNHRRSLLAAGGVRLAEMSGSHLMTSFALAYGGLIGVSTRILLPAVMIAMAIDTVMMPVFGYLSDRIGRRPVYNFGIVTLAVFAYPFFRLIESGSTAAVLTALIIGNGICHAAMIGVQPSLLYELFPVEFRSSGLAIAQAIASVIVGFVPLTATLIFYTTSSIGLVAVMIAVICSISYIAVRAADRLRLHPAP